MSAQGVLLGMLPRLSHAFIHSRDAEAVAAAAGGSAQHLGIHIADLESEYTPLLHGYKQELACVFMTFTL